MTDTATDRRLFEHEARAQRALNTKSNWGRWGEADERGAANLVTEEVVRRGVASISRGRVYSLASEVGSPRSPRLPVQPRPRHFMEIYGAAANQVNLESDESATDLLTEPVQQPRRGFAVDTVLVATHGTTTHLDALCHVWEDGTLYNGFPAADIRHDGALTLGIENLDGLVTRGVLLDVARLRGVATLAPTDLITDDDVRLCEAQGGFQIESGDAVLIHTGWPATYTTDKRAYARSQPGVGASAGLYLADRDISLLGADNSAVQPYYGRNPADDVRAAISDLHLPYLRNLGIYLLEMLDLSTLARDRVDQFLFCLAPLKVTGGTGSPVNPIAVG